MSEFDVRSSFVSFVDHLPSDIIRKLWLIQSLDISYDASKQKLDTCLKRLQKEKLSRDQYHSLAQNITALSEDLLRLRSESLAEAKSISATIKLAKQKLENQHKQLEHDYGIYQNENDVRDTLSKHAQRANKRMNSKIPKVKLKINISKSSNDPTTKRSRGRPPKIHITVPTKAQKGRGRPRKEETISSTEEITNDDDEDTALYCVCKKPSFGDMVACDNPKCKAEWFHYSCVGLTRAPRGKWFCPPCSRRKLKKAKVQKR